MKQYSKFIMSNPRSILLSRFDQEETESPPRRFITFSPLREGVSPDKIKEKEHNLTSPRSEYKIPELADSSNRRGVVPTSPKTITLLLFGNLTDTSLNSIMYAGQRVIMEDGTPYFSIDVEGVKLPLVLLVSLRSGETELGPLTTNFLNHQRRLGRVWDSENMWLNPHREQKNKEEVISRYSEGITPWGLNGVWCDEDQTFIMPHICDHFEGVERI